jgi:hypothetical protein
MSIVRNASTAYLSSQQGARWLIALQQPDGSLRDASNLGHYYKTPFALTVSGHNRNAERMLDFIAEAFLKPDGDLDGSNVKWFDAFRTYGHAWLTIAAMMRGRFEMAQSLMRLLTAFHDGRTGGFFATAAGRERGEGRQEVMSTSLAGLACLWAGRLDIAEQTGNWLRNLFEAQPDLSRGLYHVWDTRDGLVTAFPAEEAKAHLVDAKSPNQWYFQFGISAAFLASLSAATRDERSLKLAKQFLSASKHCQEDVYRQPTSGKIGWGAAWTYRLSSDPEDRGMAEAVALGLASLQNEDGSWSARTAYEDEADAQFPPVIDVTAEFVGLQGCIDCVLGNVSQ